MDDTRRRPAYPPLPVRATLAEPIGKTLSTTLRSTEIYGFPATRQRMPRPHPSCPRWLGREPHRHVLDAPDEGRAQPLRLAVQREVRQAIKQRLEHHPQLQPRQARAQAEVLAEAEGDVVVRGAADVEAIGLGEDLLVAV